jgi:hypothetical protein
MNCKVFISTPATLSGAVNRWLGEGDYVIEHMSQSYNKDSNNIILTIIYTEIIDNFKTASIECELISPWENLEENKKNN